VRHVQIQSVCPVLTDRERHAVPRQLRSESAGTIDPVLNRGDQRESVFKDEATPGGKDDDAGLDLRNDGGWDASGGQWPEGKSANRRG
jgi:hypothetical protein